MEGIQIVTSFEQEKMAEVSEFALSIQFAAAAVATSTILIYIPNVETLTITAFLLGYLFHFRFGYRTLLLTLVVWEFVATVAYSVSLISFPFKLIGWIFVFLLGTLSYQLRNKSRVEFMAIGALGTLVWDIILTLPTVIVLISTPNEAMAVFISSFVFGIPFTIVHVVANSLFFFFVPDLINRLYPNLVSKFPNVVRKHEVGV